MSVINISTYEVIYGIMLLEADVSITGKKYSANLIQLNGIST